MKRKPLQILIDKAGGYKALADNIGVHQSIVYRWHYKENGLKKGRRPNIVHAFKLAGVAKTLNVKSLTVEYLAGL